MDVIVYMNDSINAEIIYELVREAARIVKSITDKNIRVYPVLDSGAEQVMVKIGDMPPFAMEEGVGISDLVHVMLSLAGANGAPYPNGISKKAMTAKI